jgi:hypothetical protein
VNSLENRVRAAARAIADTVPPTAVPPLRLPEAGLSFLSRAALSRAARPRTWPRWLAPTAAAAAVIVIVIGAVAIGGNHASTSSGPTTSSSSSSSSGGGPVPGPPASAYVSAGQVPAYFVQIQANANPNFVPSYATVRATATGKVLATIGTAAGYTVLAVTAAADDRTFVLDEAKWVSNTSALNQSDQTRVFYLLRLNSAGLPAALTRLPMTAGQLVTGLALSSDGSKLAIAVQPQRPSDPSLEQVRIYTLATDALRTWAAQGVIGDDPDDAGSMSWTADGKYLAFDWLSGSDTATASDGTWLLNTTLGGGSLLDDSRFVRSPASILPVSPSASPVSPSASPVSPSDSAASPSDSAVPSPAGTGVPVPQSVPTCQLDTIVTPDGSAVVCGAIGVYDMNGVHRNAVTEFYEFSTSTGRVASVLGHWHIKNVGALVVNVLWSNADGSILIGAIPDPGSGRFGIIRGNTFTALNTPANAPAGMGAAW